MSRIGKLPITIPNGVDINIKDDQIVVKGQKGQLSFTLHEGISVKQEEKTLVVERMDDSKAQRALHGLTRALINNMVKGIFEGFKKQLEIQGIGYSVELRGNKLLFTLGYSHQILMDSPEGITFEVGKGNIITVSGVDKQKVGVTAAKIRSFRPPEPYKGKGIRYLGEQIKRKAGKAVKS